MTQKNALPRSEGYVGPRTDTRRTVTRGIAWTTPVVAVAATAPAFAASCELGLVLDVNQSCKKANENKYRLVFQISNGQCPVPDGCTATISKVQETTGQGVVLWTGSAAAGAPIIICQANNMAANLAVTASISCDGGTPKVYTVKMNQFTNNASTCAAVDFTAACSTP